MFQNWCQVRFGVMGLYKSHATASSRTMAHLASTRAFPQPAATATLTATVNSVVEGEIKLLLHPVIHKASMNCPNIALYVEELRSDKSVPPAMPFGARATGVMGSIGMGIDKSDIRNVIQNGVPENILSWAQELRCRRDGKNATTTILYRKSDL